MDKNLFILLADISSLVSLLRGYSLRRRRSSSVSDSGGRFAITNESVHYHHRSGSHLLSDGYSCHGRDEQVKLNENLSKSVSVSISSIIPPWVHVIAKSTKSTSLRTKKQSQHYEIVDLSNYCINDMSRL